MLYWKWKQNFRRPGVFPGSFLVFYKMNRHHLPLQEFALAGVTLPETGRVLDVGCGGGGFIALMAQRAPELSFAGVDYSELSVKKSRATNRRLCRAGKLEVFKGEAGALPFPDNEFALVTASETIYFWPDPARGVAEMARVCQVGGQVLIACDSSDREAAKKYTDHIHGMTVYTPSELAQFLSDASLTDIDCRVEPDSGMVAVTGRKAAQ